MNFLFTQQAHALGTLKVSPFFAKKQKPQKNAVQLPIARDAGVREPCPQTHLPSSAFLVYR